MKFCLLVQVVLLAIVIALGGCSPANTPPAVEETNRVSPAAPTLANPEPDVPAATLPPAGISPDARRSLDSLKKLADYPLYTMSYYGEYSVGLDWGRFQPKAHSLVQGPPWGCSLFAALADPDGKTFGRNFDWNYSPALLLFTYPQDGYSSVSMVDIAYLVDEQVVDRLADLPLEQRMSLLDALWLPFDGMNEAGVAIGMAAVPGGDLKPDSSKGTLGSLQVMREVLDHAGDVEEAIAIFEQYNLDWGSGPRLHYMVADRSGKAILVEFVGDELVVLPNADAWHLATNFVVNGAGEEIKTRDLRYRKLIQRLAERQGSLSMEESINLLSMVAQPAHPSNGTQWSVVYGLDSGEVHVVMGQQYDQVHDFRLNPSH